MSAENRHIFRGNVLLGLLRNGGIVSSHKRMRSLLLFCLVTVNTNEYILNITILSFHGIWKEYLFVEYKFTGKRAHMYKARAKVYNVYHVQIHITFLTFTEPNMSASLVFWEVQFPFLFLRRKITFLVGGTKMEWKAYYIMCIICVLVSILSQHAMKTIGYS